MKMFERLTYSVPTSTFVAVSPVWQRACLTGITVGLLTPAYFELSMGDAIATYYLDDTVLDWNPPCTAWPSPSPSASPSPSPSPKPPPSSLPSREASSSAQHQPPSAMHGRTFFNVWT